MKYTGILLLMINRLFQKNYLAICNCVKANQFDLPVASYGLCILTITSSINNAIINNVSLALATGGKGQENGQKHFIHVLERAPLD